MKTTTNKTNKSVQLISSPLRASIAITLIISVGGLLWACFAKIPFYVNGYALLLRSGSSHRLHSHAEGELNHNFNELGVQPSNLDRALYEITHLGKVVDSNVSASLAEQVIEMTSERERDRAGRYPKSLLSKGSLLSWIDSPAERAILRDSLGYFRLTEKARLSTAKELEAIDKRLQQKVGLLRKELTTQRGFLKTIKELNERGFASKVKVLEEQSKVDSILSEILSHQERIAANQAQLLQAGIEAETAGTDLVKDLRTYAGNNLIFAEHDFFVTGVLAPNLTQVREKDPVLRVSLLSLDTLPDIIPGFLSQQSAQQVAVGMNVLATPIGMSRAQYGGMLAKVLHVERLPSSITQIRESVGSEGVADELTALIPQPTKVVIQLETDASTQGSEKEGIKWSSSGKIPYTVRQGDLLSIQITTQRVRPISLLIPWLRSFTGTTAPMLTPKKKGA